MGLRVAEVVSEAEALRMAPEEEEMDWCTRVEH